MHTTNRDDRTILNVQHTLTLQTFSIMGAGYIISTIRSIGRRRFIRSVHPILNAYSNQVRLCQISIGTIIESESTIATTTTNTQLRFAACKSQCRIIQNYLSVFTCNRKCSTIISIGIIPDVKSQRRTFANFQFTFTHHECMVFGDISGNSNSTFTILCNGKVVSCLVGCIITIQNNTFSDCNIYDFNGKVCT